MKTGARHKTKRRTSQPIANDNRPSVHDVSARDAGAGESPGGARPILAQDSTSSNRCCGEAAVLAGAMSGTASGAMSGTAYSWSWSATHAQIVASPVARRPSRPRPYRPRRSIHYPGPARRDSASRSTTETELESSLPLARPRASVGSCGQTRTRRILALLYAPAFPADRLKHLSLKSCFSFVRRT